MMLLTTLVVMKTTTFDIEAITVLPTVDIELTKTAEDSAGVALTSTQQWWQLLCTY